MLRKVSISIAIITLILVVLKLINPSFEPFENFIFAWLSLMFFFMGLEYVVEKRKIIGSIFIVGSLFIIFSFFVA
ncbi:hypothetical protein [Planococcus versutus]|uniref:DUF3953 domain-containing protein n=1 Tax=Planococcus versutus TaxID=1302659 RepID=A0A1B1S630_9BACL|nr:hypothetical protein [Planococcus versutus]ANU28631.1 hypothetical protein I858_016780 [Planococcus versutus]